MKKFAQETVVGIFVLAGLAGVFYLTVNLSGLPLFQQDQYYTIQARFNSVQGLNVGTNVNISGVPVGRVDSIKLNTEQYVSIATFKIRNDITLYDDAIASIRTNGLIGDRYVKISPGGSGIELEPGDMIIDTESALDIESLVGKMAIGETD